MTFRKLAVLFTVFVTASFGQQWSIGYWTQFGTPIPVSAIQWDGLTHVVQGEALVNSDGTLDLTTYHFAANAPALIAAAHSANVKVLVGLEQASWLGKTTNLQQAVSSHLAELVSNVVSLVNTYQFDGVDIDWEPFDISTNGSAMITFLAALRAQLPTTVMTAAAEINHYRYWGAPAQYLDRVDVMTYDMAGLWDPYSWHNSALYASSSDVWSVDLAVQRFTRGGVPTAKLGIGIPFYGWQWTGGGIWGPNQYWNPAPTRQQVAYNQILSQITTQNFRWDATAQVPYLTNNAGIPSFLSYDDEQSIAAKVNYAKTMGLGGWIIWQLSLDYFSDRNPQHPLVTAIRNAMSVAPSITSSSALPAASLGASYSQSLTATGTTPITWSVAAGALPAGLTLGSSTGIIGGTPSSAGTFAFTLRVANAAGTATRPFSLTVSTPPVVNLLRNPSDITKPVWVVGGTGSSKTDARTFTIGTSGLASISQLVTLTKNSTYTASVTITLASGSPGTVSLTMYAPGLGPALAYRAITPSQKPQTITYTFNSGAQTQIVWEIDCWGGTGGAITITGATLHF
jgi:hypothetical protein